MFYEGDLQSGIALALQESKFVACFVRDEGEESSLWQDEFLVDESIKELLEHKTVLLRLQAGSQEAGYLAAIFPLPKIPTLVIIHNGQLKEYVNSGTSKEDFLSRVKTALESQTSTASSTSNTSDPVATSVSALEDTATASSTSTTEETPRSTPSPQVQDLLAERRIRLEAEEKKRHEAEKAERAAKARAKREELDNAAAADPQKLAERKYAEQQRKRQAEARAERARILKLVEDDKIARRAREAERKAQAEQIKREVQSTSPQGSISERTDRREKSHNGECALQIRLFDGTTIRSRFSPKSTLRKEVRAWIDEEIKDGPNRDIPYSFKLVLTPQPNRNVGDSEEEQPLEDVGLAPSATLILVPIKEYSTAYQLGGAAGYARWAASAGYGAVSTGANMVTGVLGSLFGGRTQEQPQAPAQADSRARSASRKRTPEPSSRVRRLGDDRKDDHQLYNGNALNFEPRPDDDKRD